MTREILGRAIQGRKVDLLLLCLLVVLLYLHQQQQTTKTEFAAYDIAKPKHLYPQNKQSPINDVYANISKDKQTNWTCSGCNWMTCSNSKDRLLFDEYIVKCFQRWSDVANELSLLSVPIYGSLIASYYRNATIMKWEYDLDVWVWAHDVTTLIDYQETYNNNQYTGNVSSTYPYESWIEIQEDWKTKYKEAEYQRAARFHYELPVTLEGDVHSAYVDIGELVIRYCDNDLDNVSRSPFVYKRFSSYMIQCPYTLTHAILENRVWITVDS